MKREMGQYTMCGHARFLSLFQLALKKIKKPIVHKNNNIIQTVYIYEHKSVIKGISLIVLIVKCNINKT